MYLSKCSTTGKKKRIRYIHILLSLLNERLSPILGGSIVNFSLNGKKYSKLKFYIVLPLPPFPFLFYVPL